VALHQNVWLISAACERRAASSADVDAATLHYAFAQIKQLLLSLRFRTENIRSMQGLVCLAFPLEALLCDESKATGALK